MKKSLFFEGVAYEAPSLMTTIAPAEVGFEGSTGTGDIDDPNKEEWEDPWS